MITNGLFFIADTVLLSRLTSKPAISKSHLYYGGDSVIKLLKTTLTVKILHKNIKQKKNFYFFSFNTISYVPNMMGVIEYRYEIHKEIAIY